MRNFPSNHFRRYFPIFEAFVFVLLFLRIPGFIKFWVHTIFKNSWKWNGVMIKLLNQHFLLDKKKIAFEDKHKRKLLHTRCKISFSFVCLNMTHFQ